MKPTRVDGSTQEANGMEKELSQRNAATLREAARVMRTPGCTPNVLRALRCCPLTAPELCRVFRTKYRPRTIYGALQTLRLVGLAQPTGHKTACLGGVSEKWRAT